VERDGAVAAARGITMADENELTEALLEMHFHRALVALFEEHFGRKVLQLMKPSQRREALLGFDQGWVRTEIPLSYLRKQLAEAISKSSSQVQSLYVGYFLQFKRVIKIKQRPRDQQLRQIIPMGPSLRAKLDMVPNKATNRSQHETLLRLAGIVGCDVNYACPMMFSVDEVYDEPNLDLLRIVPLAGAPTGYASNQEHYICFQDELAPAIWCSDPVQGESFSAREWIGRNRSLLRLDAVGLLGLLDRLLSAQLEERERSFGEGPLLPQSLTLVEFGEVQRR